MPFCREKQPIYLISNNPSGWLRNSLPQAKALLEPQKTLENLAYDQETRWFQETGVTPYDSRFTIIFPIHNEERSLHSALGTFMLADIPGKCNINVVLVTNACTDKSVEIVKGFMSCLGEPSEHLVENSFHDDQIDSIYRQVRVGNISFLHLNTDSPGKANALNIGNRIAMSSNHRIAISIDANNYIEPDSIRIMFKNAYDAFVQRWDGIVLLHGIKKTDDKLNYFGALIKKGLLLQNIVRDQNAMVMGVVDGMGY